MQPNILVTNDDGPTSVGVIRLAQSLSKIGHVTVVTPESERSGSGAATGPLIGVRSRVSRIEMDGVEDAWTIDGTPALCVMLALHGMFDRSFDLVVSGINPGANCGSSVYYSGTVGAIIVARNLGVSGLAVSQMTSFQDVHGQSNRRESADEQEWEAAAEIARMAASSVLSESPTHPVAVNINVPNRSLAEMNGVRRVPIARHFGRSGVKSVLTTSDADPNSYAADFEWGTPFADPDDTDDGVVKRGYVAFSVLSHLDDHQHAANEFLAPRLSTLFGPTADT